MVNFHIFFLQFFYNASPPSFSPREAVRSVFHLFSVHRFVKLTTHPIVLPHHKKFVLTRLFLRIGKKRRHDVDRVFLFRKAVFVQSVGILHRYKARNDRNVEFGSIKICSRFWRSGLSVVPPHGLLGINQHQSVFLQKRLQRISK